MDEAYPEPLKLGRTEISEFVVPFDSAPFFPYYNTKPTKLKWPYTKSHGDDVTMRPLIEFCMSNLYGGTMEIKEKLEENEDYDVIEYGCLGNCGQCYIQPYALVNGEVVAAETADELYHAII